MKRLSKEDYDTLFGVFDVGIIFLDHRFIIPNLPSRLLSYMQANIPVLACTDQTLTSVSWLLMEDLIGVRVMMREDSVKKQNKYQINTWIGKVERFIDAW